MKSKFLSLTPNYEPKKKLNFQRWQYKLRNYPDKKFAQYFLGTIKNGKRIGFVPTNSHLFTNDCIIPTTITQKIQITNKLIKLIKNKDLLGPFYPHELKNVICSPIFGVNTYNFDGSLKKVRIVHHLSYKGNGSSINDHILKELCTTNYEGVKSVLFLASLMGKKGLMYGGDQKAAYHAIRIHPDDYHFFGFAWCNKICIYNVLDFGLCSAPHIFNEFADVITWIVINDRPSIFHITDPPLLNLSLENYLGPIESQFYHKLQFETLPLSIKDRITLFYHLKCQLTKQTQLLIHYLDDWTGGHPLPHVAWQQWNIYAKVMKYLGLELNKKCQPPNRQICSLGAEINLDTGKTHLSLEKAHKYVSLIKSMRHQRPKGPEKQICLKSIGQQNYAAFFYSRIACKNATI